MTNIGARRRDEVLLQLSDLHFGADHTATGVADRDAVLRSLVESLDELDAAWRPSIVATTGDVGWAGRTVDYQAASNWFSDLASALELQRSDFLFTPGNHDVERGFARTLARAPDHETADRIFENGIPEHYQKPFEAYVGFCRSFGARPYSFRGAPSYLLGTTTVGTIRFVGINSCWFSQGPDDKGKLRLSLALMKLLEADAGLIQPGCWDARPVTVALMHHPQNWLEETEISDWNVHGQGSYLYLASRVHLLLCGHTHELPRGHGKVTGGGIDLRCGASFAGAGHPNTYQLVRFRSNQIDYRQFQFENRPTVRRWHSSIAASAQFSDAGPTAPSEGDESAQLRIGELRARLARYAADYVDAKSRALTPMVRPKLHPLRIEIRMDPQPAAHHPVLEQVERLPLEQVIADTPRLLIWGDLGTGKSTLVGMFAEKTNLDGEASAVLVPATQLMPAPATGLELLTRVSRFVHESSFPERDALDLREEVLANGDETVLIVDGLDEIDNRSARKILGALESLPDFFPRLRVVATSRAVGHEYGLGHDWPSATMAMLLDEERLTILTDVAVASGPSTREADKEAKSVLVRIGADAIIEEATRSPMALRLMYRELRGSESHRDRSLGEMLYRLLGDRLVRWEDTDEAKGRPTQAFCEALPGAHVRLELLSALAIAMYDEGPLLLERAEALLRVAPALYSAPEAAKAQALRFFEWTNLVRIANGHVEFALRPLLEVACAPVVLERLGRGETVPAGHWRIVAFAAAIARERGLLDGLRPALLEYIRAHKEVEDWLLAACYIVAESRDAALATDVVSWRSQRPFERPLFAIAAERRTSATAFAMTIHLAGDPGFEWFHASYLDPRYPILHQGSAILDDIFEHWISLQGDCLSPRHVELLSAFPGAHLETNSPALRKLVPLAVLGSPSSVAPRHRAALLPRLLTLSSLSSRVETFIRRLRLEHHQEVQEALWEHILVGHENAPKAAELWLEGAPLGQPPPVEIIALALRSRGAWEGRFFSPGLWNTLTERLGAATWERFCRWHLSESDANNAVGAALHLIGKRPALAADLREVLLKALRDGNHTAEAEPLLASIAEAAPLDTARWLARRIAEQRWPSATSSWWRLFLSVLPRIGEDGPPCLAAALGGLGPHVLSRHSDVRRLARRLGQSAQAEAYVKVLEEKLRRGTSAQRYGAAKFLICIGEFLGEALLTCARARMDHLSMSWEWDRYCLSLRFPAAAIDHVLVKKDALPPAAKLFVLGLAAADGRELEDRDLTFVAENGDKLHGMPPLESLLLRGAAFRYLERAAFDPRWEVAANAASALLHGHVHRLDRATRVRCEILASNRYSFDRRFREFECNATARDELIRIGRSLGSEYGMMFVQVALAEASADPAKWPDALSILFRQDRIPTEPELAGWGLLTIGNEFPRHGEAIGAAARSLCLQRPSNIASGSENGPWLVLLAHEFGAIDTAELVGIVAPYRDQLTLSSIHAALAARIPDSQPVVEVRGVSPASVVAAALHEIGDADRDESATKVCELIPRTLYRDHVALEFEQLAARGARPRLIAAILQYLHGLTVEPAWVLKIIASDIFRPADDNACHIRLRALTGLALRGLVREQPDRTRALLRLEIDRAGADCLNAGMLVVSAGWSFSAAELAVLLVRYSEIPYIGWRPFLRFVIAEAAKVLDLDRADAVLRGAVSQSLELLAGKNLDDQRDPLALVVYACLAWLIGAESVDADRAFRQGLAGLSRSGKQGGVDSLAEVVDLLKRVDPQRIREALRSFQDDEPAIVAIALLLSSVVIPAGGAGRTG